MIQYDFDSDFLFARNTRQLTDIAEYARVSKAQTVEVTATGINAAFQRKCC